MDDRILKYNSKLVGTFFDYTYSSHTCMCIPNTIQAVVEENINNLLKRIKDSDIDGKTSI